MKFYYTGASSCGQSQIKSILSLGGALSSSEIQNDILNNIFSSISELSKQNLKREAILIALKNTINEVIQNVTLTFNVDDWNLLSSEFSVAFVNSKIDDCGCISFDKINDAQSLPYLDFEIISELNNSFNIGTFQKDQVIGIWLVRKILKDKVKALTCAQLEFNYNNNIEEISEEDFQLVLSWEADESGSDSV